MYEPLKYWSGPSLVWIPLQYFCQDSSSGGKAQADGGGRAGDQQEETQTLHSGATCTSEEEDWCWGPDYPQAYQETSQENSSTFSLVTILRLPEIWFYQWFGGSILSLSWFSIAKAAGPQLYTMIHARQQVYIHVWQEVLQFRISLYMYLL